MSTRTDPAALDKTFTATLERSSARGGWTYVATDWSADFFGTRGLGQGRWHGRRPSLRELLQRRARLAVGPRIPDLTAT